MRLLCGIDEAGRGAVIGPLVIAGVVINENDEGKLKEIDVKDSKLLTRKQREELFGKIVSIVKSYHIAVIRPEEIDDAVKGVDNLNLNWLEGNYSAGIINYLEPEKVIVDCPSTNVSAYRDYLGRIVKRDVEIIAEHKADFNYPIVSAAAIIAKVTRDNEIDKIKNEIGIDFGSGYPSDPLTVEFLEKNFKRFPEIFRKSWMTFRNVAERKAQRKLGEY